MILDVISCDIYSRAPEGLLIYWFEAFIDDILSSTFFVFIC